jgi:hypothetical protein
VFRTIKRTKKNRNSCQQCFVEIRTFTFTGARHFDASTQGFSPVSVGNFFVVPNIWQICAFLCAECLLFLLFFIFIF